MRPLALAWLLAGSLALLGGVRQANAQAVLPCAIGAAAPFDVPLAGVDAVGRPFAVKIAGWYGPYDGFGYPAAANTVGVYAGLPINRWDLRYAPAPCPLLPAPPAIAPAARDA
jgi:hypothetical protein